MTEISFPAGTTQNIAFNATYSADWSEVAKQSQDVAAADVSDAKFMLKKYVGEDDTDAVVTKTLSSGITKEDGKLTVTLAPSDTAGITGKYFASLRVFLTSGNVQDFEDTDFTLPHIIVNITRGSVKAVS
ncbi:hypothetical protein Pan258_02080 [Symmachiella dynata]|uniref:hypothetical protein n=1 Tax=Symmachiella dynata TaxID=2527995 RepID=UPI0011883EB3|nr:hypothetical protein [Symmachiella dynata]QDT46191.1 hypothetical protein Pan258_02080 [Symmachiella dynata]